MALASPSLSELFEEDSKYLFRDARLKSYTKNWPHKEPNLSPEKMADAGFFFNPGNSDDDDDNVQCPFCFKQLTGWEPDDDPLLEHQKRQDRCYFVRMGKKEEDWTVQNFMLLLAQRRCASLDAVITQTIESLDDIKTKTMERIGNLAERYAKKSGQQESKERGVRSRKK